MILPHIEDGSSSGRNMLVKIIEWIIYIINREINLFVIYIFWSTKSILCRSQWPRRLRRWSAAVFLPGLRVRIPPKAWMAVCCECCVLLGRGLCDRLITRPEESYWVWRVVVCDRESSIMGRPLPTGGLLRHGGGERVYFEQTLLTLRRLSYIYIYIYGAPILDVSRSHTTTQHSR